MSQRTNTTPDMKLDMDHLYLLGYTPPGGRPRLTTWGGDRPLITVIVTGPQVQQWGPPMCAAPATVKPKGKEVAARIFGQVSHNADEFTVHPTVEGEGPSVTAVRLGGVVAIGWYYDEGFVRKWDEPASIANSRKDDMATKQDVLRWIRALNRIYGMRVRFRTGTGWGGPLADLPSDRGSPGTLIFPPDDIFYDRRVVAHEYAHIIREGTTPLRDGLHLRNVAHDQQYECAYREVCLHLGVFPTPTPTLMREFRSHCE